MVTRHKTNRLVTFRSSDQPQYAQSTEKCQYEFCGLSTDAKPIESDIGVNSLFLELDTGSMYYYTGSAWEKVGG